MVDKAKFYINHQEFLNLIKEAISFYANNKNTVNQQIHNVCLAYDPYSKIELFQIEMVPEYAEILIKNIVLFQKQKRVNEIGQLDYSYSLVHQNFRDALAAFYICSCLYKTHNSVDKTFFLDYADFYVKNYMAEHLSKDEVMNIW